MLVIVCGSRTWTDTAMIRADLEELRNTYGGDLLVVQGGAPGADQRTRALCRELGIHSAEIPALWHHHGRAAGPIRNKVMLSLKPNRVYAYHDGESPGTAHMIREVERDGTTPLYVRGPVTREPLFA